MKLYIHANCQGGALAKLFSECCSRDLTISYREIFSVNLNEDYANYFEDIVSSDVIFAQPVSDNYRDVDWLSTSWIKKIKPPNTKLIFFPVIYHRGQLPQCFPMGNLHEGRIAYHDAHALEYFLTSKSSDEFCDDTERSDFFSPLFVRSEAYLTTAELLRRENAAGCRVKVADIIEAEITNSQPLFSVNHPSRNVLAQVGNELLNLVNATYCIPIDGPEILDQFIMAPYLSTVLALGHNGNGVRLDEMRFANRWESRREYFREIFCIYRSIGADVIAKSISAHPEIGSYLCRFHRSGFSTKADDPRKLIEGLYTIFLGRMPNSNDVLHHLRTLEHHGYDALLTTFPRSPEFYSSGGGKGIEDRFPLVIK